MKIYLESWAVMPTKAHAQDAGWDLYAPEDVLVPAKESAVIDTGVHIQLPERTAGLIRPRSGLNIRHGVVCDGVIDPQYTGSIFVKLYNLGGYDYRVRRGDRIAQLVIVPAVDVPLEAVAALPDTARGTGGLGSSGR